MMDVSQYIPKITAMEFFNVDMQLFPTVILYNDDTIATYRL